MVPGDRAALAISNFLRQHDLVQVQWVFLSPGHATGTPQRDASRHRGGAPTVQDLLPEDGVLRFPGLLVVVGGGTIDPDVLSELRQMSGRFIAADGGAIGLAENGLMPEAIIGDLDSVGDLSRFADARIVRIAEQETTDFEKALYSTAAPVTVGVGMTGKRLDHTLAALDAIARHAAGRHLILVDEHDMALAVVGDLALTVEPGERVSVHPLTAVSFAQSLGLDYPLDGLMLAPGVRTGTSNRATTGPFAITVQPGQKGTWLLIVDRKNLKSIVSALLARA